MTETREVIDCRLTEKPVLGRDLGHERRCSGSCCPASEDGHGSQDTPRLLEAAPCSKSQGEYPGFLTNLLPSLESNQ